MATSFGIRSPHATVHRAPDYLKSSALVGIFSGTIDLIVDLTFGGEPIFHCRSVLSTSRLIDLVRASRNPVHAGLRRFRRRFVTSSHEDRCGGGCVADLYRSLGDVRTWSCL
jgi:hypothetical protein